MVALTASFLIRRQSCMWRRIMAAIRGRVPINSIRRAALPPMQWRATSLLLKMTTAIWLWCGGRYQKMSSTINFPGTLAAPGASARQSLASSAFGRYTSHGWIVTRRRSTARAVFILSWLGGGLLSRQAQNCSEVFFLLGVCYSKISREDLARVWWKKALEVDPHHFRAHAYLKEIENRDPTNFEIVEEGSGAIAGDLENCWDPTK